MNYVTSADDTRIRFDQLGEGEPLVLIGGLFNDRQTTRPLADELARSFAVINYDRRGRGESTDTPPYAPEREIEDLAALIRQVGGRAAVYGHSSGAGLALNAAGAGVPISRLILHEPPYGADDAESQRDARALAEGVKAAVAEDRRADAIALFLTASGTPPDVIEALTGDPRMLAVAPTMPYDFEVMGDFGGGTIPVELVGAVEVPTLVIAGDASPDFFLDTARRIAELLPDGELVVLEGQDHGAPAQIVAPVVAQFLAGVPVEAR